MSLPVITSSAITRPEHELLLCCVRTRSNSEIVDRLRTLARVVSDWEYLFLLARRHAVVPLLYIQLRQHASDLVPGEFLVQLKQRYQENAARNLVFTAELCRLIDLFAKAGVEAIPYKGPTLSLLAYNDLALRRFVDLDIIVRKKDVCPARDLLLSEGYELAKSLGPSQQQVLLRTQHNIQFTRDNRKLIVELHWEVASHLFASSVQADDLWRNLKTVRVNGRTLKTLSADDLLFSLCVHGSRHLWERLAWICDVAELISRLKVDWPSLFDRAAKTDSERMFLLGLYLAESLFGPVLPADVRQQCAADKRILELAGNVVAHLFNGAVPIPATSGEIFRYNVGVRSSWRARARYFAYMLRPTDADLEARALPRNWEFAYYLMRPFRLFFKPGANG